MPEVIRTEYFPTENLPEKFFFQTWRDPNVKEKGLFFLTHGISEHSECYDAVATELAAHGWHVLAWDLYGHGRSPGQRGYVPSFSTFSKHMDSMLKFLRSSSNFKSSPLVLFGHSMGGLITIEYLLNSPEVRPDGVVLSSPALGITQKVSPLMRKMAESLAQLWPKFTLNRDANPKNLVRDPDHIKTYSQDPLRHSKISSPLFLGMEKSIRKSMDKADLWDFPLLLQVAGQEKVTSTTETLRWFKKIKSQDISLKIYDESYHEIYNDLDRKEVIDHLLEFLRQYEL